MSADGFVMVPNSLVDQLAELKPLTLAIYVAIRRHDGKRGCFPSEEAIAEIVGTSERSVQRALGVLKERGFVETIRRRRQSHVYRFPNPNPTPVADQENQDPPPVADQENQDPPPVSRSPDTSGGSKANRRLYKNKNKGTRRIESASADAPGAPPAELLELLDGWNSLPTGIVKPGNGARLDPPANNVMAGWRRAQKNAEQRKAFSDIPAVLSAIQRSRFLHGKDFFRPAWLFGKNQDGEFKIVKLMEGAYESNGRKTNHVDQDDPYGAQAAMQCFFD